MVGRSLFCKMNRGTDKVIMIAVGKEKSMREDVFSNQQCRNYIKKVLLREGYKVKSFNVKEDYFEDILSFKEKILKRRPFCVFNLFEGFSNDAFKEAEFVLVLEELNLPFTGNPAHVLKLCLDKFKAKEILKKNNLPVPEGVMIRKIDDLKSVDIKFPLFLKPCFEDASVGIDSDSLVEDEQSLYKNITKKLKKFPSGIIIEEFIKGKEYNVGFLGNYPYECLGVSVLDYSEYSDILPFLSYASKWDKRTKEFANLWPSLREDIPCPLYDEIVSISRKAAKILGCRGYFRVDLREANGKIYILEVNPNPDISPKSGFIRQAKRKGYTYKEIIIRILKEALGGRHCKRVF